MLFDEFNKRTELCKRIFSSTDMTYLTNLTYMTYMTAI